MSDQVSLEVDRQNLEQVRWVESDRPKVGDGEVLARVDMFAFTANNITYAAVGDEIGYWKFFPASVSERGIIPVWGFADIVESSDSTLSVGERLYGYWPMSNYLMMRPAKVSAQSFLDATEHRRELPTVYNQYYRCAADPAYQVDHEPWQAIFRPLFITSFMIDDFLSDNQYFGAEDVIISSASAKTAFGTAFLQNRRSDRRVIGLTSPRNVAFVEALGCYDQVLSYERVGELDRTQAAVYIDVAGNSALRGEIHHHYQDQLKFSSAVGYSHLGSLRQGQTLPGPKPQFFFAPTQVQKREHDWRDTGGVLGHYAQAWTAFLPTMRNWITIKHQCGTDAIGTTYQQTLAGQAGPQVGQILSW